ncbi:hypothetical protein [Thalassotalea aquiviva]|uniref:hypothetical protein n=1 Tax=Thalassotalea aquiviva TaxID=3242415 RepID=UPI00352A6072
MANFGAYKNVLSAYLSEDDNDALVNQHQDPFPGQALPIEDHQTMWWLNVRHRCRKHHYQKNHRLRRKF